MPLLGGLLVNLFGAMVAWLSQWVTRKVAFGLAAVTMMSGLTVGLMMMMRALLSALAMAGTGAAPMFVEAIGIAVPPTAIFCVSTYMTAWTGCTVYKWQRDLVHLAVKA